jgi:rRNA maturation RNase YbeY
MDELRPHSMAGPNRSRGRDGDEPEPVLLGDVVLCPQVAAVQAGQHGHSTQAELELLTVHGVLHLLGYDHADPEEEAEMFGLQNELLRDWRLESAARTPSPAAPAPADPSSPEPSSAGPSASVGPSATADPSSADPSATAESSSAEPPATRQSAPDDKASGPSASGEGPEGPALCPPPPGCWSSPSS